MVSQEQKVWKIFVPVKKNEGLCGSCKKSRCEICEHNESTDSFKLKVLNGPTL